jgi:hypothetical protein
LKLISTTNVSQHANDVEMHPPSDGSSSCLNEDDYEDLQLEQVGAFSYSDSDSKVIHLHDNPFAR